MKKIPILLLSFFLFSQIQAFNTDSLLSIARNTKLNDTIRLQAYEDVSKPFIESDKDFCREICNEGLIVARELNNVRWEWSFYNRIGITYIYEGNLEETAKFWIKGLEVAESHHDTFAMSQSLNNLGLIYYEMGEYEKAINYYTRSIDFKDPEKEATKILYTKVNIGNSYLQLMDFDEAGKIVQECEPIIDTVSDLEQKRLLLSFFGNYHMMKGSHLKIAWNRNEAKKYLEILETYLVNTNKTQDKIVTYLNLGDLYLFDNDLKTGNSYMRKASKLIDSLKVIRKLEDKYEIYHNYYSEKGNYKMAYFYLDSLTTIKDSINNLEAQQDFEDIKTKYETEKKERENLQLREKVREEELESDRQRNISRIFIAASIIILVFLSVVLYLFSRLRIKNSLLLANKKELEALNDNLKTSKEETEKALAFKSSFLANMSHEIRTPLNIIIGFNSILKKKISDPVLLKYLDSMEMSSYNLLGFLNDILDMSKIEAGKMHFTPDSINLRLLITNIRELFQLKANDKNIDFSVEVDSKVPQEVLFDEIRLRQILFNLIGNALKFTNEGFVKVKVDSPVLNLYQSEFSTKVNIRIQVVDSGIGISKKDLEPIFESFRQVNMKEQTQMGGTGLGLAISKRLTEMMNGEIAVESEKGKGSTFTVMFKDVQISTSTANQKADNENLHNNLEYEFTGGVIVVADDEEMNRSLIKVCFENTKVEILEAKNGQEAIDLAKSRKPNFIIMDIKMPGIDGLEATQIISSDEKLKDVKIIAFSASNIFERLEEDEIDLFSGLISKPVLLDDLYHQASKYLPHKIKETASVEILDEVNAETFRDANLEDSLEQNQTMLQKMVEDWNKIYNTNSMNKIIQFTNDLSEFASKNNLTGLKTYAQKVREAGENFDIDLVKKLLKLFPELMKSTN